MRTTGIFLFAALAAAPALACAQAVDRQAVDTNATEPAGPPRARKSLMGMVMAALIQSAEDQARREAIAAREDATQATRPRASARPAAGPGARAATPVAAKQVAVQAGSQPR